VPLDLAQLRDAIRDASQLMQDPTAGVVTGMEVVPWSTNPAVDALLSTDARSAAEAFLQVHRLEGNVHVLTAIEQARATLLDEYYATRQCESALAREFLAEGALYDRTKTLFAPETADHDESRWMSLESMAKALREVPASRKLETLRTFLDGTKDRPGALACIQALEAKDLREADYQDIPACRDVLAFEPARSRFLDEYCPPRVARRVLRDGRVVQP
jgi:hypothetical protein